MLRRLGSVGSVGSKGRQANLDSAGRYAGARPATAPAYTHTSGLVVCDRASPRPRAPPRLDIPNGTALDRLSATRQASSQSTEYLNAGGLRSGRYIRYGNRQTTTRTAAMTKGLSWPC